MTHRSGAVVDFTGITRLDLPAQRILDRASEADLKTVVVIGWDADGGFYGASSAADGGDVLWLLELCKQKLFESARYLENGES